MKIALVRRAYSPSGGAEKYLLRLAENLVEKGHEVELVTSAKWPEEVWPGGRIHTVEGHSPVAFADAFRAVKPSLKVDYTFSLERVWEADLYRAGDGVHQAWLSRLAGQSSALSRFLRQRKAKHRETIALEHSLYAPPSQTKIIANSQLVADEIASHYGTEPQRIRVIPNGYDAQPLQESESKRRTETREKLGIKAYETALLFVGSGWKRKGAAQCIAAMDILAEKGVKLILAGKGKPPRNLHLSIQHLGEVKDVRALYHAADLFILPTLYDPFSNACLEAAAYGLPVITSKENGFAEALQEFGGGSILENLNDSQEIVTVVESWLDPAKREANKVQLSQLSAAHTRELNIQRTLDFILSATNV